MVGHGDHDSPFLNLQEPTNADRPALEQDGSIKIEDLSLQSYWQVSIQTPVVNPIPLLHDSDR